MAAPTHRPLLILFANSLWNLANFRGGLIVALRQAGYRVEVAGPGGALTPSQAILLGPVELMPLRSEAIDPLADVRLTHAMATMLKRRRPAAVLSFTPKPNIYGAIAARVAGVNGVPNVSGLGSAFLGGGALRRVVSGLYRIAFARVPAVFFQNPDDRDLFVTRRLVRAEQARLLPGSGVDCDRFAPRPRSASADGAVRFLFVGRLLAQKGLRELIDAIRIVRTTHPQARFALLGPLGGANRSAIGQSELDGWIAEGLVEYLGAVDDVRPHLAGADAVILPSWREGLPRSLLEAAAMGRPRIASDVPGCREIVRDGVNGLLHEVRSAAAIAAALTRFCELPAEARAAMGTASRRIALDEFGEQRVIDADLAVLARIAPLPIPLAVDADAR